MSENHVISVLSASAEGRTDAPFAELPDGSVISYGDLWVTAGRYGAALVEAGVQPGDRVTVQVEKSIENLAVCLGAMLAGGVYMPLNTAYTEGELEYFLTDAEPRVFVCDPARHDALAPYAAKAGAKLLTLGADGKGTLRDAADRAETLAPVAREAGDLAAILYTSGTTGRSKGAMLSHANLGSNATTLAEHWRFSQDDVLIHALPIFHTHGLFVACNVTLIAGSSLIWLPKFAEDPILEAMPRATAMMGVPTFYTRLLDDERLDRERAENMRLFVSGSAPLLAETHKAWEARTGHRILERYGMSECGMITSNPYDGERRAGTVGFGLPGVEVEIRNTETAQQVPDGEVGIIEVRGPNVFQGYWQMPEKTAEELRPDGWLITGDMGRRDEDGYISIVGRSKDLIISGGYNIYPKEVESEIDAIEGVNESAVIGVPHPDFGEGVVAAVVAEKGAELTEDAILKPLQDRLARFKQPKRVVFLDALPRNAMGKVQKADLRETYSDSFG